MLVGPFAGVFVDRWDKRRTMLAMDLARAGLIGILLIVATSPSFPLISAGDPQRLARLVTVYLTVVLATACTQFFSPARLALIGDIVSARERDKASGLSQMTTALATIIGPPLAAPLLFGLGIRWALTANALSFLVSFGSILFIRAPASAGSVAPDATPSFLRELRDGLRLFTRNRVLTTILIVGIVIMLGAGAINALDVFFVRQNLHASASLYGVLGGSLGLGLLIGTVAAGWLSRRLGAARVFWMSVLLTSLGILVYARLTDIVSATVVLFLTGMPMAALNVAVMPLMLQVTPREFLGRVSSVLNPAIGLATMLSIVIAGWLDSTLLHGLHFALVGFTFGPVDTIFTAAGLLALASGIYAFFGLRTVPRPQDAQAREREGQVGRPV